MLVPWAGWMRAVSALPIIYPARILTRNRERIQSNYGRDALPPLFGSDVFGLNDGDDGP